MIKWQTKSALISELKDYEHNPRRISAKDFNKLVKSLKEDGYHQRIIINKDGTILGGHQRKNALLQAGFKPTDLIDVIVADKQLTPKEIDDPESERQFDAQVWQLGEHKLISMDGDDLDYINGLLKGGSALVVTVDTKHIAKVITRWEKETKKKAKLVEDK